jgi:hypothetical protein
MMSTDTLTLGGIVFDDFSTPHHMPLGGQQAMVVHRLPGGSRVIDTLGPDDDDYSWDGTFIAYLVDEQRIVRQLGCLAIRCGGNPNATHIRRIVVWEKPVSAAMERIDQCVASTGVVRNVRSITAAT